MDQRSAAIPASGGAAAGSRGVGRDRVTCWGGPWASSAGGRMSPPPHLGKHGANGRTRGCVQPREETFCGAGRSGRKTKRGRESGGEPKPGAIGTGGGPAGNRMPGPARSGSARPALRGAHTRIAAVVGRPALPGRRARLSARRCIAALQEPAPSPLPSPPSAAARLQRPSTGQGPTPSCSTAACTEHLPPPPLSGLPCRATVCPPGPEMQP